MKGIKKYFASLLTLIALFTLTPCVHAEEQGMTVKRDVVMESYIGDNNGFTGYVTTDGTIVYCMDLDKPGATTGTAYTYSKSADAGLLYIMENGYPNKKITNRNEIDRYITQAAVWWYLSDTGQTTKMSTAFQTTDKEAYSGIRDQIKALVAGAKQAKTTTSSIKIQKSNTTLSISSDEKYYDSNVMSVSLTGASNYNVTVTGATKGTIVTDENGNAKNTFTADEKFKVRVPSSELTDSLSLTVKVSAQGNKVVNVYNPTDSSYQRVVTTKITTKQMEDTTTLSATPTTETPGQQVVVPNTAASVPLIILCVGIVLVFVGLGIFWYVNKNKKIK